MANAAVWNLPWLKKFFPQELQGISMYSSSLPDFGFAEVKEAEEDSLTLKGYNDSEIKVEKGGTLLEKTEIATPNGLTYSNTGMSVGTKKDTNEIEEEYTEGDQVAIAMPGGRLTEIFVIGKVGKAKAVDYTNYVISNGVG